MRNMVSLLFCFWLAISGSASADEVAPRPSVRSGVAIRAEPTTDSERLGLMLPGQRLNYAGDAPGWHEVRLADGRTAFVIKRWTVRIEGPPEEPEGALATTATAEMFAHFVYVGQGDGAILEFPCGVAIIDTGGQFGSAPNGGLLFADYLEHFFAERPSLHNTIDVVFTTHPHADHLNGLPHLLNADGAPRYTIRNVVDNAQSGVSGSLKKQTDFRDAVRASGGGYSGVSISSSFSAEGVTNAVIDPIDCSNEGVDPVITVFWGSWERDAIRELGGEGRGRSNPNNHSLVIRVDFGQASFLFTGDLEEPAIDDLLTLHQTNLDAFDVDIYQVGHHGSANATTDALMEVMTPEIAVISMGDPADRGPSSAHGHGHPRVDALRIMQEEPGIVSRRRNPPQQFAAFENEETEPVSVVIDRAIYGTGWEGDLVLRASAQGEFEFVHSTH